MRRHGRSARPRWSLALVTAALATRLALAAGASAAEDVVLASDASGSIAAREAMGLCLRAPAAPDDRQAELYDRGLALAEQAIAEDASDAKAHFALFCNLGRKLDRGGLNPMALGELPRLKKTVDRALELAPRFVDALVGKGSMLANLPWMLGGDRKAGDRLIREAIGLAPDHVGARLELVKLLEASGAAEAAAREALVTLELAERVSTPGGGELREVRRVVARVAYPEPAR